MPHSQVDDCSKPGPTLVTPNPTNMFSVGDTVGFVPLPFTYYPATVVATLKESRYGVVVAGDPEPFVAPSLFLLRSAVAGLKFEKRIIAETVNELELMYRGNTVTPFTVVRLPSGEPVHTDPVPGGYLEFFQVLCGVIRRVVQEPYGKISLEAWAGDTTFFENQARRAYFRHFKQDERRCYSDPYLLAQGWQREEAPGLSYCGLYPQPAPREPRSCSNIKRWEKVVKGGGDGGGGGGGELDEMFGPATAAALRRQADALRSLPPVTASASASAAPASSERVAIAIALPRGGRQRRRSKSRSKSLKSSKPTRKQKK